MKLLQAAGQWWQRTSGEEETPLDGDSPAFVVSLLVHLAVLVTLGLLPLVLDSNQVTLTVAAVPEEKQVELKLPEEFYFSEQPAEEVGANSTAGEAMALSDRIVVMNAGRAEQIAPPHEAYERPATAFVASFLGKTNRLEGTVRDGTISIRPLGQEASVLFRL